MCNVSNYYFSIFNFTCAMCNVLYSKVNKYKNYVHFSVNCISNIFQYIVEDLRHSNNVK